ncbi:MAG TPA: dTDP-4-dehydrorhamnose reductase [Anaerolineae bacterium]|nr:dTDP-4-dehydrorhamnose reductase [Anaerolineae bacterium]
MKIVVTGSRGMLAQDVISRLDNTDIKVTGLDLPELDITCAQDTLHMIKNENPSLVINCAAYTAVDRAETEAEMAFAVNRNGSANLADTCHHLHIPLLHISTDFVFNGKSKLPYREDDTPEPLNIYGQSKWEGEKEIRKRHAENIIIRTAWLFGIHGNNFVKTILKLAHEREELRVVDDQTGCPTWTGDLADALVKIVLTTQTTNLSEIWGTYHFCGAGQTSWYGFAKAIIEEARTYEMLTVRKVTPITTKEYSTPAHRPAWSVLDSKKITEVFGITPMPWRGSLNKMINELYSKSTDPG